MPHISNRKHYRLIRLQIIRSQIERPLLPGVVLLQIRSCHKVSLLIAHNTDIISPMRAGCATQT